MKTLLPRMRFAHNYSLAVLLLALIWLLPGQAAAQKRCEPCFSIPHFTVNGTATNKATGTDQAANKKYTLIATVGEIEVDLTATNDASYSVAPSFWGFHLTEPVPPRVQATDGDHLDRIEVSWEIPDDRTGPPVTGSLVTLLRNGSILTTLPLRQTQYLDFNVFPGEEYEYAVVTSNDLGDSHEELDSGFLTPNGTIVGTVKTRNGNPVNDVKVVLEPNLGRSGNFEVDDYVYFPKMLAGLDSSYTVEGWFRSIVNQEQTLFAVVDSATTRPFLRIQLDGGGQLQWEHRGSSSTDSDLVTTPVSYTDDSKWHHFAAVLADSNLSMTLYVDGRIAAKHTASDTIGVQRAQVVLGKLGSVQHEQYYQGRMDDWRVWSVPKSRAQIRRDMDRTLEGDEEGLLAYWKFDEVKGDILFDLTDNDNDGQICEVERSQLIAPVFVSGITDIFGNYAIRGVFYGTGTTFTATPQKETPIGRALQFDGIDDYIAFPNDRLDLQGGYTLEGWFKQPGGSGDKSIFVAADPGSGANHARLDILADGRLQLTHLGVTIESDESYNTEFWYHFAATHDLNNNGALTLYVDGEEVGTATGAAIGSLSEFVIGRQAPEIADQYFLGVLDEIRVWDRGRSKGQINDVKDQVLQGNETGMVAYWKINEGDGVLVTDATGRSHTGEIFHEKDGSGDPVLDVHGKISKLALWVDDIPLNEVFTNAFEPESRQVLLTPNNTAVDRVDFTDISQIAVSGFFKYSTTTCFIEQAEILVNGESLSPPRFTDESGKFIVEFEPGAKRQQISVKYRDHQVTPEFIELPTIITPLTGLFFEDIVKREVRGKVAGGVCEYPITPMEGVFEVRLASTNGCFEQAVVPDAQSGDFTLQGVPPVIYQMSMVHPNGDILGFFDADTLSAEESDRERDFIYRALPEVAITGFPLFTDMDPYTVLDSDGNEVQIDPSTSGCGLRVMKMADEYDLDISVFETYAGSGVLRTCPADSGTLTIIDHIGPDVETDTSFVFSRALEDTTLRYRVQAWEPNITDGGDNPFQKNIEVTATDALGRNSLLTKTEWSYVTGNRTRGTDFATTSPSIPFLILRDPPGDQSFSYFEEGKSVETTLGFSFSDSKSAGAFAVAHLGPDLEFEKGISFGGHFATTTAFDFTADFEAEFDVTVSQNRTTEQTWSFTSTERYETTGDGDVYVGGALNILYGITDVLEIDPNACAVQLREDFFMSPSGFATTFIFSEDFILDTVIPELEAIAAADDPDISEADKQKAQSSSNLWFSYIVRNQAFKQNGTVYRDLPSNLMELARTDFENNVLPEILPSLPPGVPPPPDPLLAEGLRIAEGLLLQDQVPVARNISFDAGALFESSETVERSKAMTVEFEMEIDAAFAATLGLTVNGVGAEGGVRTSFQTAVGQSIAGNESESTTTGFVLSDDDGGDNYNVAVLHDPVYSTPVFQVLSGTSSCPYEEGTISRDGPQLSITPSLAVDVAPDEAAVYTLGIGNISAAGEDRQYALRMLNATNPNGAELSINGADLAGGDGIPFDVPFGQSVQAVMSLFRGPEEYEYDDIQLQLFSPCESDFLSSATGFLDGDGIRFDKAKASAHFIVPCSEVAIAQPQPNWLVTAADQATSIQVNLNGYDRQDPNLEKVDLLYRPASGGPWLVAATVPKADLLADFVLVDWPISPSVVPDNEYELRARAVCGVGLVPGSSPVVKGRIDREGPRILGLPEPSDGILDPDDQIAIRYNEDINCGAISVGAGHIVLTNKVTGQDVDFNFTCGGNEVFIDPNVENVFLENLTLEATVGPLEDLFGNGQSEPITWEFFVNRNPIEWTGLDVKDIVIFEDEDFSTTRTLINNGGSNRTFALTDLPTWLDVEPREGTILPGEATTVTFSVDGNEIGAGSFKKTIFASGDQGNEPRAVDVRVLCHPPQWGTVNPNDFQHSMTFTAKLHTDNEVSTDKFDRVGVFIDEQLHGVAQVDFIPELAAHPYEVFLTVYGNDNALQRDLDFRVWDASECRELGFVEEDYTFQTNVALGTPSTPVDITATRKIIGNVDFLGGWNWFSLNLVADDMTTNSVLGTINPVSNDIVRNQRFFSQYVNGGGWVGNLDTLTNESMYLINLEQPTSLEIIGLAVDVETTDIPIEQGWNWIGFLPQQSLGVNEALASLDKTSGDIIKSQFEFAQYVETVGWVGSLKFMNPKLGYQHFAQEADTLFYPFFAGDPPAKAVAAEPLVAFDDWQVDPRSYRNNMTLVAAVEGEGSGVDSGEDVVAAFVGDQCRGIGQTVYVPTLDRYLAFVVVYGDDLNGEAVEFRFFDGDEDVERFISTEVAFRVNETLGTVEQPFVLETRARRIGDRGFIPNTFTLGQSFPNPFNPTTQIGYGLPQDGQVNIAIYNLVGQKIRTLVSGVESAGYRYVTWNGRSDEGYAVPSGMYFYVMQAESFRQVKKVMLLK